MFYSEENVTVEDLGRNGFKVLQSRDGFRFGTDSVLLGWFASSFIRSNSKPVKVLELGANTGAVSLCVAARKSNAIIDSVEIMPHEASILERNIAINSLEGRMRGFNADVRNLPAEIKSIQYDVVMFNPPYFNEKNGTKASSKMNASGSRAEGRFEMNGGLDDFIKVSASRVIPSSGHVCMVMHGERLIDAINAFSNYGIKATRLITIHSFEDRNASAFLLAGKKGSLGNDLRILPPLILNSKDRVSGDIITTERLTEIYEKEHTDCFI